MYEKAVWSTDIIFCAFFTLICDGFFFFSPPPRNLIQRVSIKEGKYMIWLKGNGFGFMESLVNGFSQVFESKLKGPIVLYDLQESY